ncbi:MAG: VOC family protein [Solirubrobacterales bacterium]|nr:VOC family protein [Solirubrobacterales bacterium]
MRLDGIHHISAITGNAPANVEFYAGVLGLRMVKKTVNQDDPSVYHLFYADENGTPGSDLTFFEYPGAPSGRAGDGMIHRIVWRVGSADAIEFWAERLAAHGITVERADGSLRFDDPEGLGHELVVSTVDDRPLVGGAPDVPREYALQGFDGVRAYSSRPEVSERLLRETLGFTGEDGDWEVRGESRGGRYVYDPAPEDRALQGAGTVHHIAFTAQSEDLEAWQRKIAETARPTPVIDRFYFRSVYFREPSGVLFELATPEPGFAADEDQAHLGERLSLPPKFEPLRAQLEERLTPLPDPRAERKVTS